MQTVEPSDLTAMLAAMRSAWGPSHTPSEKRDAFAAWTTEHKPHVDRLHALVAATMAWWLIKGREAGHDSDILDQVALQAAQSAIAKIARTMKARQGEQFSPARVAIVAYQIAAIEATGEPIDLDGMTQAVDAIEADTAAERDRLRDLIDEIADMDLGEPEIEHREIIARCREEQRSWMEDDA